LPQALGKSVAIIGFMGAGKSTIGEILASKLQADFVDLDEAIARRAGKSIRQLFLEEGESFFRRLEQEELIVQSASTAKVLACGGGVVLDEENVKVLRANFYIFYLEISVEEAINRLSEGSGRPLIKGKSIEKTVTDLMKQRSQIYSSTADEIIKVDNITAEQVAEELFQRCRKLMFKPHEDHTRS